jgi:hypothetical protein
VDSTVNVGSGVTSTVGSTVNVGSGVTSLVGSTVNVDSEVTSIVGLRSRWFWSDLTCGFNRKCGF